MSRRIAIACPSGGEYAPNGGHRAIETEPRLAAFVILFSACVTLTVFQAAPPLAASETVRDMAPAAPESVGISSDRVKRIDTFMKQWVDQGRLAGIVTLLTRHGKVVNVTANGRKDIRNADPVQRDSIFRIYSMTKPVTGVAMMMLFEEGKWRLNDPVSRYIPEFAKLKVYAGENPDGIAEAGRRAAVDDDARADDAHRGPRLHHQRREPGRSHVSQGGRPRLAQAAAVDDRRPRRAAVAEPAGNAVVVQHRGRRPGLPDRKAVGHELRGLRAHADLRAARHEGHRLLGAEGKNLAARAGAQRGERQGRGAQDRGDATIKPLGASGGGGLFSTADDYARFCEMLLEGGQFGGRRLLAPRTVEMMRTNHVNPDPLKTMPAGTGWGMDFQVILDAAAAGEPTSDGTFSWWGIAGTFFWIDPVKDLAFVGMIQTDNLGTSGELRGLARNLVYQSVIN